MPEVSLVVMPYMAVERPSIAAGILKAGLARRGIEAAIEYANILFADAIGIATYHAIASSPPEGQLGEWTFSGAAFPQFEADHSQYLDRVARSEYRHVLHNHMRIGADCKEVLLQIRAETVEFVDALAREIVASGARIVGCSSIFQQQCASLALLRRVKELAPGAATVLGGANCEGTMGQAIVEQFGWVDYVFSGEADDLFPDFCERLLAEPAYAGPASLPGLPPSVFVRGAAERRSSSAVARETPRGIVHDMERVPIPDYSDYFAQLGASRSGDAVSLGLLVEMSRGCWWGEKHHCTFCGLNGMGMGFRAKSPERVQRELEELAGQHGIHRFFVVDNILGLGHLKQVLPALAEEGASLPILLRDQGESLARPGAVARRCGGWLDSTRHREPAERRPRTPREGDDADAERAAPQVGARARRLDDVEHAVGGAGGTGRLVRRACRLAAEHHPSSSARVPERHPL